MNCNALGKKVIQWFNENKEANKERDFTFRFRGKESFNYLQSFPSLISWLKDKFKNPDACYRLMQIFYQSLYLRKIVSFSVRIEDIVLADTIEMEISGQKLFRCAALFDTHISPSLWTFCQVSPKHTQRLLETVGFGLGINTMEGREQKHQMIKKYSANATYQHRWKFIFRHEFIQLVYLRENGYDVCRYRKRQVHYLPDTKENLCVCGLTLLEGICELCDSKEFAKIEKLVQDCASEKL